MVEPKHEDGTGPDKRGPKKKREPGSEAEWAMVRHTKWIIGLTFVTAVAAILAAVFAGLQWGELHSGGADTHNLAVAAHDQAIAASEQEQALSAMSNAESGQLDTLNQSVDVARSAAKAANTQVSIMQAEQRPWVSVKVIPKKLFLINSDGRRSITLSYDIIVENFGHIPARDISPSAELLSYKRNSSERERDAVQRQMCAQAQDGAQHDSIGRIAIYPNEPDTVTSGSDSEWEPSYFYLIGCIDFTYGANHHGKTAFRYLLGSIKNNLFDAIPFPQSGGSTIPNSDAIIWSVSLNEITFKRDDRGNYPE